MRKINLPFAFLLPLLSMLVWIFLVPIPSTLNYLTLQANPKSYGNVVVPIGSGTISVPGATIRRLALEEPARDASHILTGLNMPAVAVEILISLPTTWPSMWHPADFSGDAWRSIAFPFYCLPAWWFVGRGFDALQRREKLKAWKIVVGTISSIGLLVLCVGLTITQFAMERDGTSPTSDRIWWPMVGMVLWGLLLAVYPLAWLRMRRIQAQIPGQTKS